VVHDLYDFAKDFLLPVTIGWVGFYGVIRSIKASGEATRETSEGNAKLARENMDHNANLAREQSYREAELAREQHNLTIQHKRDSLKSALAAELFWNKTATSVVTRADYKDGLIVYFVPKYLPVEIYQSSLDSLGLFEPEQVRLLINAYYNIKSLSRSVGTYTGAKGYVREGEGYYQLFTTSDEGDKFDKFVSGVAESIEQALKKLWA
jgi:hypothetical protein